MATSAAITDHIYNSAEQQCCTINSTAHQPITAYYMKWQRLTKAKRKALYNKLCQANNYASWNG